MSRELQITAAQEDATQRNDLRGAVYLLSGTVPGRGSVSGLAFRWSTHTFSGALGEYEAYLGPPQRIQRGLEFGLGGSFQDPAVLVPVRNLPFGVSPSLVAAVVDGDYAWEHTEVTLRVGYLKPGQGPEDLAAADWTALVLSGFLGAPRDMGLDGFNMVVYPRGARRSSVLFKLPRLARTNVEYVDGVDEGRASPVWVGRPDSWYPVPFVQLSGISSHHLRGYTVSGYAAGATEIQLRPIGVGLGVDGLNGDGAHNWHVHTRLPLYITSGGTSGQSYDPETNTVTLHLSSSGLAFDVPRGAVVQERNSVDSADFTWLVAGHRLVSGINTVAMPSGTVGWLFPDGTVKPADPTLGTFFLSTGSSARARIFGNPGYGDGVVALLTLDPGLDSDPNVPLYFDPAASGPAEVSQQPEFTSDQFLETDNFPSGGSGTGEALARDGNEDTSTTVDSTNDVVLTFNSAPAPFANGDTTLSIVYIVATVVGTMTVRAGIGGSVIATLTNVSKGQYRFVLPSPENFNADLQFQCGGSDSALLYEAWWHHALATTVASTRTQDTIVAGGGVSGGEVLEYARLVIRLPLSGTINSLVASGLGTDGALVANPWAVADTAALGAGARVPYPSAVMAGLQGYFLGSGEGHLGLLNSGSYQEAHDRFLEEDIRWSFVLDEQPGSWFDLEADLAMQGRFASSYGPSGHELLFLEVDADLAGTSPLREFRMPGVPGANTFQPASPWMERTPASQVQNRVAGRWDPDYTRGGELRQVISGSSADSIATYGLRGAPDLELWAHSPWAGHPAYNASGTVSGLVEFYAARLAEVQTRFQLEAAWPAHGLDRGSVVRLVFPVALSEYRHVVCEVEEVAANPINAERVALSLRTLEAPIAGISPAFTWEDVFLSDSESWTDRIAATDAWSDYWSTP